MTKPSATITESEIQSLKDKWLKETQAQLKDRAAALDKKIRNFEDQEFLFKNREIFQDTAPKRKPAKTKQIRLDYLEASIINFIQYHDRESLDRIRGDDYKPEI